MDRLTFPWQGSRISITTLGFGILHLAGRRMRSEAGQKFIDEYWDCDHKTSTGWLKNQNIHVALCKNKNEKSPPRISAQLFVALCISVFLYMNARVHLYVLHRILLLAKGKILFGEFDLWWEKTLARDQHNWKLRENEDETRGRHA